MCFFKKKQNNFVNESKMEEFLTKSRDNCHKESMIFIQFTKYEGVILKKKEG